MVRLAVRRLANVKICPQILKLCIYFYFNLKDHIFNNFILEIVDDKPSVIPKIADFLNISDYDLNKVIAETTIDRTRALRQAKYDAAGRQFDANRVYRSGTKTAWEQELTAEVLEIYYNSKK